MDIFTRQMVWFALEIESIKDEKKKENIGGNEMGKMGIKIVSMWM